MLAPPQVRRIPNVESWQPGSWIWTFCRFMCFLHPLLNRPVRILSEPRLFEERLPQQSARRGELECQVVNLLHGGRSAAHIREANEQIPVCPLERVDEEAILLVSMGGSSEQEQDLRPRGFLGLQGFHCFLRDHRYTRVRRSGDRQNYATADGSHGDESQADTHDESLTRPHAHSSL